MNNTRILVVDDEPQIRRVMRATLSAQGYDVEIASNGREAIDTVQDHPVELILLDMKMPVMDGLEACRELRSRSDAPIIIVSVRNTEKDKVEALDAGADDYVTKPFGMEELLARIRAALRRMGPVAERDPESITLGSIVVDFEARRIIAPNASMRLTPKEFDLLRCLAASAGKVVHHRKLLQTVWGPEYGDEVEYLRVFINQLRKKIEPDPQHPRFILTEPWVGYRLAVPPKE